MEKVLKILNQLEANGKIKKYAIAGGIASIFYIEPLVTYDLDIIIESPDDRSLQPFSDIYEWLKKKGYTFDGEHIMIEGVPVQFLPAYNNLVQEALQNTVERTFGQTKTKVLSPEYLVAIMVDTFRQKDKFRILKFIDEAEIDREKLERILSKYKLKNKFESVVKK